MIFYYYKEMLGKSSTKVNQFFTLHRTDGPAFVQTNNEGIIIHEEWYQENELHRSDGPAQISYDHKGGVTKFFWFLEGEEIKALL